ncbi:MAG: DUF1598 domain-containing protein [Planctomycetota bacterium]
MRRQPSTLLSRLARYARYAAAALAFAAMTVGTPAVAQFGGGGGGGLGGGGGGGLGGGGGGLGGGGGGLGGGGGGLGGGGGGGLGGGGGGGLGGGGGGATGGGGVGSGVVVNADGVLRRFAINDPNGVVLEQRAAAATDRLAGDLKQPSKLRKVSLTRLEDAIADRLAAGEAPTDAMHRLAGLTRIDYVFCYPETGEVVLAGPAEPWFDDGAGRVVGVKTGSPIVELQDLVTAMRAYAPAAEAGATPTEPLIYCSIDPTEEGLADMQRFLVNFGRQATPADTGYIVSQLREKLGLQQVTVGGVPADTHFAQVLVEADYRMKLIGIGLEEPLAPIKNYVSRVSPRRAPRNALVRWFFVPDYERLRLSDDGLAMEIVGEGVRLVGEDEMVTQQGERRRTGATNAASRGFVTDFTRRYADLARVSPVYAQLRNCIDLAVVAACMRQNDFYGKAAWDAPVLMDETKYPVRTYNAPERVASAVNSLWKGSTLMTPIGGGVMIRPTASLDPENVAADDEGKLAASHAETTPTADAGVWWWD